MCDRPSLPTAAPFIDIRIGGLHLTVQRLPIRLMALLAALSASAGSTFFLSR
ncbi:hypothetical protein [Streptomyces griseoaurantiacus]|uniref:Uncharacterized protein n=1 Tax=Streptomyces griseoaurantiacus TaxID=68213 RepID=A0A1G7YHI7_9ACTN|nr:hypothetical protein [Streptomyces jietaisiensis]SDG95847.1 hypothetical protein SAMN05216260_1415 [Streptomyces jietaisiensis]